VSKLEIVRADLAFEASLPEPDFGLFGESAVFLDRAFRRLAPHGLRLSDLRLERGAGNVTDLQIVGHMLNHSLTIRFRIDKVEVVCSDLPTTHVEAVKAAIIGALAAVVDHRPKLAFKAFGLSVGMHATIEGQASSDYLARFAANVPKNLGPLTGYGCVFYFGAEGNQLNSSVTVDLSALVQDGIFVRTQAVWDAQNVKTESLIGVAEAFRQRVLGSLGLEAPAYS
jgi:hypothetical protein